MITLDALELQRSFSVNRDAAATRERPNPPREWWKTGVLNLAEVGPVIASQYRIDAIACIRAIRDQFPGGNLEAIRDFAYWCSETYKG